MALLLEAQEMSTDRFLIDQLVAVVDCYYRLWIGLEIEILHFYYSESSYHDLRLIVLLQHDNLVVLQGACLVDTKIDYRAAGCMSGGY
ncbi:hypothetical protein RchiOBHm_Chr7g0216201 [Rosa chinensis]|uniref:Uncharacterized protein n=1 Tax=Rosa chinensis TaxID=74649 RepID=A0A2P6PBP9_ROSCH|nr:hypothetical protein RchiOBHm_Chr7g0216201 [Rosa chinensis]